MRKCRLVYTYEVIIIYFDLKPRISVNLKLLLTVTIKVMVTGISKVITIVFIFIIYLTN